MATRARIKPPGKTQAERDAIALGRIESYMDGLSKGYMDCPSCGKETKIKELPPAVATLMRARYDKLRPTLQAIEQHVIDDRDRKSEADIVAELSALLAANPGLLDKIQAVTPPPVVVLPKSSGGDDALSHTSH